MQDENMKICVIEDMLPIRKLIKTILEKAGFTVFDFPNAKSFLDWIKDNEPIAVVVDILLPDINGTELLQYIRELNNGNKIAIVAVTGFAQTSDKEKYLQLGFDAYIPKPINTLTFPDEIKMLIEQKSNR